MADSSQSTPTYESLARSFESHLLKPELSDDELAAACRLARELGVAALIVRPCDIDNVTRWMAGSPVVVGSFAGFPDGSSLTGTKLYEGRDLLRRGAREIHFVVNPGKLVSRQFQHVETELMQMADSCEENGAVLKVCLRNEYLADDLKIIALRIARRVGAQYISISPADHDLDLIRPLLKERIQLHAATVDNLADALRCQRAGCSRIASEKSSAILAEWRQTVESLQQPQAATPIS
jgi:deoxyribose-phosphate aldolase